MIKFLIKKRLFLVKNAIYDEFMILNPLKAINAIRMVFYQ